MNTTTPEVQTIGSPYEPFRITTAGLGIIVYTSGFIGNFLSLLVFIRKELRQVSTSFIFLLLNIFSTIHLFSLLVEFLDSIFQVQMYYNDKFRCQFILWLQNSTRTICSFLAATVSIDRYLRSEYPMKSRIWCTTKNVMKISLIYFLFSIIFYTFFFDPLNVFDASGYCSFPYQSTFRLFALNIMPPIRFVLICVIPSMLMIGCGIRMLSNIRQAKRRVAQQGRAQPTTIAAADSPGSKGITNRADENRRQSKNIDQMLVLMVLANVIAYLITQIPFNIYALYYGYETSDDYSLYALLRAFLLVWSSIYFGTGFYLFCITSPQFRKEFKAKFKTLCICYR